MKTLKNIKPYLLLIIPLMIISFTTGDSKSEYTLSKAAISVFSTDLYLSGSNDLLVGHKTAWGESNITVTVLNNFQYGNFFTDTTFTFCGYQENIFAINIDNDNYPDLVTFYSDFSSGSATRYIRIYYNENGEYNNYTNFNLNSSETFTTVNYGDVNGDGYFDLLVISSLGQFWGVLYNDGTGNFSSPQYHNVQDYYPSDISCADLNDDGREDIVIVGQKTEVYFSYSNGFQLLTLETNSFKGCVIIDDFDQNGTNDIAASLSLYPYDYTLLKFYNNLGNNNIVVKDSIIFQPLCFGDFNVSDFNNDSFPDLLFHPADNNNLLVIYNQENFDFGDSIFIPMADYGETSRSSSCSDFDGNGYSDIATIRYLHSPIVNLNILFNDGNGGFSENPITNIETQNPKPKTQNLHCFPNPFKTELNINYNLTESSFVEISVFSLSGELIKVLTHNQLEGGDHQIKWDGLDIGSKPCKPGSYLLTFKVNGIICNSTKLIKY